MTSLAVRLETSSKSRKEGREKSQRGKERERGGRGTEEGEGQQEKEQNKRSGRQRMHFCSFTTKRSLGGGESDAKKPCVRVCVHRITSKLFIYHMLQ